MNENEPTARVVHVITGLDVGGAEMMLYRLLSCAHANRAVQAAEVISLADWGPMGDRIHALGVPVRALGMRSGMPDPRKWLRLIQWLREARPDVVQTWMYHADLLGGLAAKWAGGIPVVWGLHQTDLALEVTKRSTLWVARVCARLSPWLPERVVCCAETVRQAHLAFGYVAEKMRVIPNGFDLEVFRPDPAARSAVHRELGIPEDAPLIGLIGRFHPQKDHQTFIRAAALLRAWMPETRFMLGGEGITWENAALTGWIRSSGLEDRCHLLGRRDDVPRLLAALDIATTSSSAGEAFPLVVGEAMACGVPCVVTDVGDSAQIVGDTGKVVAPRDPEALARAWRELIAISPEARRELGEAARQRIEQNYSLPAITTKYAMLYKELVDDVRNRRVL